MLGRAAQTKVLIGLNGIVDVGVMRTRRYGWDDIAALRMVPEPGGETESIHLIEAGGRDRLLIPAVAVAATRPDLARVCEAVTALGRAPVPPVPAIRTTRLPPSFAAILLLTSFGCFAALFVFGALLGDTSAAVDGTAIPAGREYYRFPGSDGTLGPPKIVCPSLGQWIGGKRDPMCGSAMRTQAAILGVSVTITTALLASAAWLLIKRRRMRANDSGTDPPHFERTLTT